jgi:hypothetical protein
MPAGKDPDVIMVVRNPRFMKRQYGFRDRLRLHSTAVVIICASALVGCSDSSKNAATLTTSKPAATALGQQRQSNQVPWNQVGPGWILATWELAPDPPAHQAPVDHPLPQPPVMLYLLDPAGGRYAMTAVGPPDEPNAWGSTSHLADWSDDGRHALFEDWGRADGHTMVTDVDLTTGVRQTFVVDADYASGTYSRPGARAILVSTSTSLQRVHQSGTKQLTFATDQLGAAGKFNGNFLQTSDGAQLVLGTEKGLVVIDNDGAISRPLPMPLPHSNCHPVRWWTTGVILASCGSGFVGTQLWQVPLTGSAPTALTPLDDGQIGYQDAFRVPGGTFLENVPGCGGDGLLFRLDADMKTTQVTVPGVESDKTVRVVGVTGDKLLLRTSGNCGAHNTVLRIYDPAANIATVLPAPPGRGALLRAILFPTS